VPGTARPGSNPGRASLFFLPDLAAVRAALTIAAARLAERALYSTMPTGSARGGSAGPGIPA